MTLGFSGPDAYNFGGVRTFMKWTDEILDRYRKTIIPNIGWECGDSYKAMEPKYVQLPGMSAMLKVTPRVTSSARPRVALFRASCCRLVRFAWRVISIPDIFPVGTCLPNL